MSGDIGIKISKPGFDVKAVPTEATKQNFITLDDSQSHKVFFKGFITAGTYTHNLNIRPFFLCFQTDSITAPTYFKPTPNAVSSTTQITSIPNPSYLIVFYEGI